jgi:hypothetical protein
MQKSPAPKAPGLQPDGSYLLVEDWDLPTEKADLGRLLKDFNPDQPRDSSGKWTTEGGGMVGGHKDLVSRMFAAMTDEHGNLKPDAGFTLDARTKEPVTEGYAVAVFPTHSLELDPKNTTKADMQAKVAQWLNDNHGKLTDPAARVKIGGWVDPATGHAWLDVTRVYGANERDMAMRIGTAKNQIAIANLGAIHANDWDNAFINLGGTGKFDKAYMRAINHVFMLFDADASAQDIVDGILSHSSPVHGKVSIGSLRKITKAKNFSDHPMPKYVNAKLKSFAKRIREAMLEALPSILTQIGSKLAATKVDYQEEADKILADLDLRDYNSFMIKALRDELAEAFQNGVLTGASAVGVVVSEQKALEQVHEQAVQWAGERAAELVGMSYDAETKTFVENPNPTMSISDTTRESLRSSVEQALTQGWSAKQYADYIKENVDNEFGWSDARAETIARTELAFANNQGNLAQWNSIGAGGKESVLADSHDKDDVCDEAADLGPVPLDFVYSSGFDSPPHHPNCLCALVPYTQTEMDNLDTEGE